MQYYSLNGQSPNTSFKDAVIRGIAPDRGLYFPMEIPQLEPEFFENIETLSTEEIAYRAISPFVGDAIPEAELRKIVSEVLDFDFPVVPVDGNLSTLELFHGPTLAFKDVGARFMARCLGYFSKDQDQEVTVLVATSGDTGGAVANGFLGVPGVKVVILYPSGKVSDIQERQLTTLGQNITALEVNGTFDDCQDMVKSAFLDTDITGKRQLTSANSINVARWLPQMFYFLLAYKQTKALGKELVFSVPSGNFGNICAGMMAHRLGMPVHHFVAATNANQVVPDFMATGQYEPKPSVATISNAMDVGDPSNFIRIRKIYGNDFDRLKGHLSSSSFSDDATREAMADVQKRTGYTMDPHGAVGYLGLKKYMEDHPDKLGIFLETAHPIKFLDVMESVFDFEIALPENIKTLMDKQKEFIKIASYADLKVFLMG
ncbi:threonine synthase [Sediminicola luteus]|uniref:Threonine synthase n=1 Tax=Sediminicola luteus TaxID=319238 RepID=A0A2A4G3E7_9FLAO|nr:threonine synthase [Sediminicola luteus]PCE62504.1 threonine synthase [Sediminicola luteus]